MDQNITIEAGVPINNYTYYVCQAEAPDLPFIQQPHSARAFVYFACALIGLAGFKHLLEATVDRSRYGALFNFTYYKAYHPHVR